MGSLKVDVRLDVSGALADGRAEAAVGQWQERTTAALADRAVEMLGDWDLRMDESGRATGAFREHLHVIRRSRWEADVPGPVIRGVTWAPWLEGTSRRNASTGFGGYHLFRRTRRDLGKEATEIAERTLGEVIDEMGGE